MFQTLCQICECIKNIPCETRLQNRQCKHFHKDRVSMSVGQYLSYIFPKVSITNKPFFSLKCLSQHSNIYLD